MALECFNREYSCLYSSKTPSSLAGYIMDAHLKHTISLQMAPFIFIIQFFAAKKLVVMPHSSFHRLAAEVGDPQEDGRKLTFVNMTARCGSTLLSQMMSRVPKVRTMSEPWTLVHLHGHYVNRLIALAEYKRLLRSAIRLQCKKEHKRVRKNGQLPDRTRMSRP